MPGLVSSGMSLPGAISTMLIYRLISWLLLAAVGWVVFFFMFRTENEVDPDDDESAAEPAAPSCPATRLRRNSATETERLPPTRPKRPCKARYRRPIQRQRPPTLQRPASRLPDSA